MEAESFDGSVSCAQAIPVEMPTAVDMETNRQRFHKALRTLTLKPSLHPSQKIGSKATAYLDASEKNPGGDETGNMDGAKEKTEKDEEKDSQSSRKCFDTLKRLTSRSELNDRVATTSTTRQE